MTHVRGVSSRPLTLNTMQVKATSLGGTVEKLEMGMTGIYSGCRPEPCYRVEPPLKTKLNQTLGQSYTNMPIRTVTWRNPKTTQLIQTEGPHRGGRLDGRYNQATQERPYSRFTVTTEAPHVLRTKPHSSCGYHGLMLAVRAGEQSVRISRLHTAAAGDTRRELYRVYIQQGHFLDGVIDPSKWREVAAGEAELPTPKNMYAEVPWPFEGIKIQAGEMMSIYIHCPYNKHGVAFRRFAKAWPGYPANHTVVESNRDIQLLAARPTFSQTPFERVSKDGAAFAGLVEYEIMEADVPIFVPGQDSK